MKDAPSVLIVDDSAMSRAAIADALRDAGIDVVGRAMDGSVALRMVEDLRPDVITCDLEMPRMDGFTFLRIVSAHHAIPVIVVTSDSRPESALMALDLGARDFVVKPSRRPDAFDTMGEALAARIRALCAERPMPEPALTAAPEVVPPHHVSLVVIGASTGGPRALRDLLGALPAAFAPPILIAQHMPPRFTEAFAARLSRHTGLDVRQARHGERLRPGVVRVAPGGQHLFVDGRPGRWVLRLAMPVDTDRTIPSVDHLLTSAARTAGAGALGIVLTGMGRDGAGGAAALAQAGASLWAESAATAIVDGMPRSAAAAHGRASVAPLDALGHALSTLLSALGGPGGDDEKTAS